MPSTIAAVDAAVAISFGKSRPTIPVDLFLEIGLFLRELRLHFSSTKEFGLHLKKHYPEIVAATDNSTRSNCIRLVDALDGNRDSDILPVLGVEDIHDFHSSNPTVIIRTYNRRKRQQQ